MSAAGRLYRLRLVLWAHLFLSCTTDHHQPPTRTPHPPAQLFDRWQRQGMASPESAPVMEAFNALAVAMRDKFEPYAKPVFEGAVQVVRVMQEAKAAQVGGRAAFCGVLTMF
jgi:hypothetical protein